MIAAAVRDGARAGARLAEVDAACARERLAARGRAARRRPDRGAAAGRGGDRAAAPAPRGGRAARRRAPGRGLFVLLVLDEQVAPERSLIAELLGATGKHDVAVLWLGRDDARAPGRVPRDDRARPARWRASSSTDARTGSVLEDVTVDGCRARARARSRSALAPVRDAAPSGARAASPRASRCSSCSSLPEPTPDDVAARWRPTPSATLAAPIGAAGAGPFGSTCARTARTRWSRGTTGAGKSELLQTLVASLARDAPARRGSTFLLVDYKGGAAFKECVGLPHTVGLVTDLDAHLAAARARSRCNAELAPARARCCATPGAKDLLEHGAPRPGAPRRRAS